MKSLQELEQFELERGKAFIEKWNSSKRSQPFESEELIYATKDAFGQNTFHMGMLHAWNNQDEATIKLVRDSLEANWEKLQKLYEKVFAAETTGE